MSTITIASIEAKPKRSIVITTEGRKLGCWTDKIAKLGLEQGSTYNVETTDAEVNGMTLTNIVSAKRVTMGLPSVSTPSLPSLANGGSGSYRPTCPQDAERMFVCATLTALIKAGEVKNDKGQLFHTTKMLRALWQHTFGSGEAFEPQHMQAAE